MCRQWCAFLSAICWFSSECLTTISLLPWMQVSNYKTIQQTRPNLYNIVILLRWGKRWNNICQHVGAVKSCWEDFQIQSQRFIPVSRSERYIHFDIFLNKQYWNWGQLTHSKLNLDEIFDSQIIGSEYILWYKGFFIHVWCRVVIVQMETPFTLDKLNSSEKYLPLISTYFFKVTCLSF